MKTIRFIISLLLLTGGLAFAQNFFSEKHFRGQDDVYW